MSRAERRKELHYEKIKEVEFTPREHFPLGKSIPTESGALKPDEFVSLKAIADREKAEIIARALNERVNEQTEELEVARLLLSEAKTPQEKQEAKDLIEEIKANVSRLIDAYAYLEVRKLGVAPQMRMGNDKKLDEYNYLEDTEVIRTMKNIMEQKDLSKLSPEERKLAENHQELSIGLLKEVQRDQQKMFEFMQQKGFRVPVSEKTDDPGEGKKNLWFANALAAVIGEMRGSFHTFLSLGFTGNIYNWEGIVGEVKRRFNEHLIHFEDFRQKWKASIQKYTDSPEFEKFLKFAVAYEMKFEGPAYLGTSPSPHITSSSESLGESHYSPATVSIRYKASEIKKRFPNEADQLMLIIPDFPGAISIDNVIFGNSECRDFREGADFEEALEYSKAFAAEVEKYPHNQDPKGIKEEIDRIYFGIQFFNDGGESRTSLSQRFLTGVPFDTKPVDPYAHIRRMSARGF